MKRKNRYEEATDGFTTHFNRVRRTYEELNTYVGKANFLFIAAADHNKRTGNENGYEIMTWLVNRGKNVVEEMAEALNDIRADFIKLVEASMESLKDEIEYLDEIEGTLDEKNK